MQPHDSNNTILAEDRYQEAQRISIERRLMVDDRNNPLAVGDNVKVLYINRDRGAELWMDTGIVVGFGRTRVKVRFPSRNLPQTVGSECLRKI